jgi:seryl-tRNA synthetase
MLVVSYIREHKEEVIKRLSIKNFTRFELLDEVLQLDDERRAVQQENDEALAEANMLAKKIGELYKQGKADEANALKQRNTELKEKTKVLA